VDNTIIFLINVGVIIFYIWVVIRVRKEQKREEEEQKREEEEQKCQEKEKKQKSQR